MESKYLVFASKNFLTVSTTVVLPAVIERMAHAVDMDKESFLDRAISDSAVGQYVCQVCRKVA